MLGGYGILGKGTRLKKIFDLTPWKHSSLRLRAEIVHVDSWDGEMAFMIADNVHVWNHTFSHRSTKHRICGAGHWPDSFSKASASFAHSARPNKTASWSLRRPLSTPSANAYWLYLGAKRS